MGLSLDWDREIATCHPDYYKHEQKFFIDMFKSGLAYKKNISVLNTPGTIDSDYRGEIKIILINLGKKSFVVKSGDRIAQMILCPVAKGTFKEVKKLPKTIRGKGGFGSTGK